MEEQPVTTMKQAQQLVKQFALMNQWSDAPTIDKFDHLHEELIEMSKHLRYKSEAERIQCTKEKKEIFVDGIGDLFFALCRLANQLDIDIEEAFKTARKEVFRKYNQKSERKP
ncbi:MAG: hypothetical protein HY832_02685 [Candidatus Aenigmarchaeota archaeon]|nr:hypothetical protein [Candidatus Aenigmarchaeota archaeon]